MTIVVKEIIHSPLATNLQAGVILFETISKFSPKELTLSFEGISHISTAFLNESIGRYVINNPDYDSMNFIFPSNKSLFKYKVDDVIENALMGDEYDVLVDNALASL